MYTELNIFEILNLEALSAKYLLLEIIGLKDIEDDYDTNIQYIIKSLSYSLKHPVTVIFKEGKPFLVVRDEAHITERIPKEYPCKRDVVVFFKSTNDKFDLNFKHYNSETKKIIIRFLQFDIQTELNRDIRLWQPGSGDAFFNTRPIEIHGDVAIYTGFFVRVVEKPNGKGFGIAVDITKKYVSANPLPVHLTRQEFKHLRLDKCHVMYQYGNKRYEINPEEFSDLNASQSKFQRPEDGKIVTLLEDIHEKFGPSMPPEVAQLPDDASVLIYHTNDKKERKAPAGLCYRVFDTEDPVVQKLHRKSIVNPFPRRRLIRTAFRNYMSRLRFGAIQLKINPQPIIIDKRKFIAPDVLFGNEQIVSLRNTPGAIQVSMRDLGRKRKELLTSNQAGFYTCAEFEIQYFIVPQTVYNMYGNETYFLNHLGVQVDKMHYSETGWKPVVIVYDDRSKRTSTEVGFSILHKIEEKIKKKSGGYALVMLPSNMVKDKRKHDDLAALVVSELWSDYEITASIMHSQTLEDCFEYKSYNGQSSYQIRVDARGLYAGYLRGVAINQVLLNNERWPYVLKTPLHADLTIGIDVKRNVAGFTFVDKFSKNILTRIDKSNNKERLSTSQVLRVLVGNISKQAKYIDTLQTIVIHRDGKLHKTEKLGIEQAIQNLIEKGILPPNVSVNIVEIPKHSMTPFRIFDVAKDYDIFQVTRENGDLVLNPEIGTWVPINDHEAYLCTTGREFEHGGSSNPLYIKYSSGIMTLEQIVEDIYFLSCLAYTKPDDCSRYPITIKITDRRINTLGSEFDFEALDILKSEHF